MECCCYLRNVQDLLADSKTPYERGPIIPFGAVVEYLPNSERDKARIHQFGKKVLPRMLLDASEIYPRRLDEKEVLITHKDGKFAFLVADGSATLAGREHEFQEPSLRREHTVMRESQRRI